MGRVALAARARGFRHRVPVKHFWGLITVGGHFDRFDGTLEVDADGTPHIVLTIDADSLDTGNAKRDLHSLGRLLKGRHPHARFNEHALVAKRDLGAVPNCLAVAFWWKRDTRRLLVGRRRGALAEQWSVKFLRGGVGSGSQLVSELLPQPS